MSNLEIAGPWGVLGGAFDPVHYGHLTLADDIRRQCDLRGVILVPAASHPFKNGSHASFEDRVNMLKLAVGDKQHYYVSDIEKEEALPGHTLGTVRALKKRYPEADLHFIIGEDNLDELHRWYHPDELLKEVPILAGYRPPHVPERESAWPSDRVHLVPTRLVDISATEIRRVIEHDRNDKSLRKMVPPEALGYIRKHRLYQ